MYIIALFLALNYYLKIDYKSSKKKNVRVHNIKKDVYLKFY